MTGWNLPPGCRVTDLPGNEPEDPVWEKLSDILYEHLDSPLTEKMIESVFDKVMELINEVRGDAYRDGVSDEAMARDHANGERDT